MCVTCGCADGSDVRITDPSTGETVSLADASGGPAGHVHTDEHGHTYVHTHEPVVAETGRADAGDRDRA